MCFGAVISGLNSEGGLNFRWSSLQNFTVLLILSVRSSVSSLDGLCLQVLLYVGMSVAKQVVTVVYFESLPPHYCWFESCQESLSCVEAIQLAYGTVVVLLWCQLVPEIMQRGSSDVYIHW